MLDYLSFIIDQYIDKVVTNPAFNGELRFVLDFVNY